MLRLEGVTLAQGAFALSADWEVSAGRRVAVIGPSGGGKSTLLSGIAGFVPPVQGRILWNGTDLAGVPPGRRPLSILFQDHNLFPHLTVAQNLGLGLTPRFRVRRGDDAAITAALARVDLAGTALRLPGSLSGGQQGRVALARAMLRARPILLLDEPFAALGPAQRAGMLGLVTDAARETGTTVLMVTHDPEEAQRLGDLTVFVAGGTAHAPHPTATLLADPPPALADYLGTSGSH